VGGRTIIGIALSSSRGIFYSLRLSPPGLAALAQPTRLWFGLYLEVVDLSTLSERRNVCLVFATSAAVSAAGWVGSELICVPHADGTRRPHLISKPAEPHRGGNLRAQRHAAAPRSGITHPNATTAKPTVKMVLLPLRDARGPRPDAHTIEHFYSWQIT
jgi:hypothetical protein